MQDGILGLSPILVPEIFPKSKSFGLKVVGTDRNWGI